MHPSRRPSVSITTDASYNLIHKQNIGLKTAIDDLQNESTLYERKENNYMNNVYYYNHIIFFLIVTYYALFLYFIYIFIYNSSNNRYFNAFLLLLCLIYPFALAYIEYTVIDIIVYSYCIFYGIPYHANPQQQTMFEITNIPQLFKYTQYKPVISYNEPTLMRVKKL
jgi:hypothetical protein